MKRKGLLRNTIAGSRGKLEPKTRSATLNVRALPEQYLSWRQAAAMAEMSLSAWVARWLDEVSGVPGLVLVVLEKLAPRYRMLVPIKALEFDVCSYWRWEELDFNGALRRLEERGLVILVPTTQAALTEVPADVCALRTLGGAVVTHVALPDDTSPRMLNPFGRPVHSR